MSQDKVAPSRGAYGMCLVVWSFAASESVFPLRCWPRWTLVDFSIAGNKFMTACTLEMSGVTGFVRKLEDVQLQKTLMEFLVFSICYICIVGPVNGYFEPYTKKRHSLKCFGVFSPDGTSRYQGISNRATHPAPTRPDGSKRTKTRPSARTHP
jgi:hypothetical protein